MISHTYQYSTVFLRLGLLSSLIFIFNISYSQKKIENGSLLDSFHINLVHPKTPNWTKETNTNIEYFDIYGKKRIVTHVFQKTEINNQIKAYIVISHGKYIPNLILLTYSNSTKKVINQIEIAGAFIDAGEAYIKSSKFINNSTFYIYEKDFSEGRQPDGCLCKKTKYHIDDSGKIESINSIEFKINCAPEY